MMVKARLRNHRGVWLGECEVPEEVRAINYGGGVFVYSGNSAGFRKYVQVLVTLTLENLKPITRGRK